MPAPRLHPQASDGVMVCAMRSLLFVPADSERKLARALTSGADALILDLEDAVAPAAKARAREAAARYLAEHRGVEGGPRLIVRVNALASGLIDADLDAIMPYGPWGVMLPKAERGADVQHLGAKLAVREAEHGLYDGSTAITPIVTETGAAMFGLGSYAGASRRLAAMAWGVEDLTAAIGAAASRDGGGLLAAPLALARNLTLFSAASAGVDAIDSVFADFRDLDGLRRECASAARDGFAGKMAIHPDQVSVINAAFTPSAAMVEQAQRIVDAFAAAPEAGVLNVDGAMVDRPRLAGAQRLLQRARM